ncbi:hypothetical protein ACA910_022071 [Epithemia clementina (nom. ined.)]
MAAVNLRAADEATFCTWTAGAVLDTSSLSTPSDVVDNALRSSGGRGNKNKLRWKGGGEKYPLSKKAQGTKELEYLLSPKPKDGRNTNTKSNGGGGSWASLFKRVLEVVLFLCVKSCGTQYESTISNTI